MNCMEKGPAPEAAERDSHAAEASCGFVSVLVFLTLETPPLGSTMSLAQVNHICIYLYIMFRHSLSAHSSSAHSLSAQVLSAHSLLVHTHVLILSHRDSGIAWLLHVCSLLIGSLSIGSIHIIGENWSSI